MLFVEPFPEIGSASTNLPLSYLHAKMIRGAAFKYTKQVYTCKNGWMEA